MTFLRPLSSILLFSMLALAAGCAPSPVAAGGGGADGSGQVDVPVLPILTPSDGSSADTTSEGDAGDAKREEATDTDAAPAVDGAVDGDDGPMACVPAQGETRCGVTCTDLQSDAKNCGTCGAACASNQFCSKGKCEMGCAATETKCGQSCVSLASNNANCGTCGNSCKTGEACTAQVCKCAAPNRMCGDACTNVANNNANCGACGQKCPAGAACRSGSCGCPAGRASCNGACCKATETCFFNSCVQF